jgi:hypothetical protein
MTDRLIGGRRRVDALAAARAARTVRLVAVSALGGLLLAAAGLLAAAPGAGQAQALPRAFWVGAAGAELNVGPDALRGIPAAALAAEEDAADPPALVAASATYFGIPLLRTDLDWGLPGHGHMLMLERGSEELAARIADWLESAGRRGAE